MGYRGKIAEQEQARWLRALGWTLADIAAELGVSKSSVSLWVRDVEFTPGPRRRARRRAPNALQRRKAAEKAKAAVEEGIDKAREAVESRTAGDTHNGHNREVTDLGGYSSSR